MLACSHTKQACVWIGFRPATSLVVQAPLAIAPALRLKRGYSHALT